ncbi:MAG TPA: DUF885 family protein [Chthonomonadaceae bacterium]|nr:DUF885 family protein [Chthonomonadaceae bacterium]
MGEITMAFSFDLWEDAASSTDRMPAVLARYQADRESLDRLYAAPYSPRRRERYRTFFAAWQEILNALPFDELSRSDRADWLLFRNLLERERRRLDRQARQFAEIEPLLPFALDLIALEEERRRMEDAQADAIAERLHRAQEKVRAMRAALEAQRNKDEPDTSQRPTVANRAAETLDRLRKMLEEWFGFYNGYDPLFTWWVEKPYQALMQSLQEYAGFLRKELAGAEDEDAIIGDPIGREALLEELEHALIPYTPEELIALAGREQDWCLAELRRAAEEMGHGEDWRAALEQVKADHVAPGAQPALVRDLAREAIAFVTAQDLVTVPPLAEECWRMEMMAPEKQKVNPFFLGGETITVSFPTNVMEHPQKRMSLRGNNRHFARATVQHELIPGHYMQQFSQERWRPYRRIFFTPFWTEGWTLHWEMLLWDLGFPRTPQERIGMLFWRLHRCARVVFSLGFHLGQVSPQECVEMLVNEVGHERENAVAEVRRSFGGDYDPLYQCAYLIGGLQVRALYRELVGSGQRTPRAFHDAFLRENCMPIAVLRALLADLPLERDFRGDWRFA